MPRTPSTVPTSTISDSAVPDPPGGSSYVRGGRLCLYIGNEHVCTVFGKASGSCAADPMAPP